MGSERLSNPGILKVFGPIPQDAHPSFAGGVLGTTSFHQDDPSHSCVDSEENNQRSDIGRE